MKIPAPNAECPLFLLMILIMILILRKPPKKIMSRIKITSMSGPGRPLFPPTP